MNTAEWFQKQLSDVSESLADANEAPPLPVRLGAPLFQGTAFALVSFAASTESGALRILLLAGAAFAFRQAHLADKYVSTVTELRNMHLMLVTVGLVLDVPAAAKEAERGEEFPVPRTSKRKRKKAR
jgi:hypothetical protein